MQKAVLLSKHQKLFQIASALTKADIELTEYSEFDTDTLGTFSGEIERRLSPKECALKKAQLACELTGADIGIGSEGSFGGGPAPGIINWSSELICLFNNTSKQAIYAFAAGPFSVGNINANDATHLQTQLARFPKQHWIYRGTDKIHKGLSEQQIKDMSDSFAWPVVIEPDLRAMFSPQRREMISKAADDLSERLTSFCPNCEAPDFVVKRTKPGLPCQLCQFPTNSIGSKVKQCECCGHSEETAVATKFADPATCPLCNP